MNRKMLLHAVVRYDEHLSAVSDAVTIVAVVPTKDEAVCEVARLNELKAGERSSYFWTPAKYYPDGRGVDGEST